MPPDQDQGPPDQDQGQTGEEDDGRELRRDNPSRSRSSISAPKMIDTGNAAGFLLGLVAWAWVGHPLISGGPTQVKNVLRAKFTNKGKDGKWLP